MSVCYDLPKTIIYMEHAVMHIHVGTGAWVDFGNNPRYGCTLIS